MAWNFINIMFLQFAALSIIFGSLVNLLEPYLPVIVIQLIRFGKHGYEGKKSMFTEFTQVPKSWYKHFYVFAFLWSSLALLLSVWCVLNITQAPEIVLKFLDTVSGGPEREVLVDSTSAILAIVLLWAQSTRRFYETQWIQIFSSKGKMNVCHYLIGYLHYFGAVIAVLANTEGFIKGINSRKFILTDISSLQLICSMLFIYCWNHQYRSNIILANLRKDSSGKVETEKHLLPIGGYFECISSPHMFFEVVMYFFLMGIIPTSVTWRYTFLWVAANQTETAFLAHQWYKENFPKYPKRRYAIFPFIL